MKYSSFPFLFLCFFFFESLVSGQLNYKEGFVIKLDNDTLYGKINDGGIALNARICVFKPADGGKTIRFQPDDIKAYRLKNDKYYVSDHLITGKGNRAVFLEVLLDGPLNLYHYYRDRSQAYYIQKDDSLKIVLRNEKVLVKGGAGFYSSYNELLVPVYQEDLASLFKDVPRIFNQVHSVKYTKGSLMAITQEYCNQKFKNTGEKIEYKKDLEASKARFGIYSGVHLNQIQFLTYAGGFLKQQFPLDVKSLIFPSFPIGIFLNYPFPVINDNFSFQVELTTVFLSYHHIFEDYTYFYKDLFMESTSLDLPVMLKYSFGERKLRPSIALGKSFHYIFNSDVTLGPRILAFHPMQKGGYFFELGMEYRTYGNLSFFSNIRVTNTNSLIVEVNDRPLDYDYLLKYNSYRIEFETFTTALNVGVKF